MLAWGTVETINKSNKIGYAIFFSRKRKKIWIKGEKSTNYQILKRSYYDCDKDSYLYIVKQINNICCHKKKKTCFFNKK
ncbi:phosphoribosyl-AMP cyclohydrolase [Candidatus Vidania fulgoroideorum]